MKVRLENDRMRQINVRQNEDDEHRKIRLINNRVRIPRTYNIAMRPITVTDEIPASHNIDLFTTVCPHCDAFPFHQENYNCCIAGQVPYEKPDDPPIALKRLFEGDSLDAKHFQTHARQYNNAFAFAAIKGTQRQFANRGPPVYCISGKMVHFYSALRPNPEQCAAFSQLYIVTAAESLRTRREIFHGILKDSVMLDNPTTLEGIDNPYISAYRTMYNIEQH